MGKIEHLFIYIQQNERNLLQKWVFLFSEWCLCVWITEKYTIFYSRSPSSFYGLFRCCFVFYINSLSFSSRNLCTQTHSILVRFQIVCDIQPKTTLLNHILNGLLLKFVFLRPYNKYPYRSRNEKKTTKHVCCWFYVWKKSVGGGGMLEEKLNYNVVVEITIRWYYNYSISATGTQNGNKSTSA